MMSKYISPAHHRGDVVKKELEPGFPVLWEAVTAVHWSALRGLKWYFTIFTTVGTDCLGHLTRTVKASWAAEITPAAKISSFHYIAHAV
ncbi:hypothetical protein J2T58_001052 [Methanocalculus alkaliphilus]|nr:hypothetical protein [Methanocalculus alkaliphilus]